MIYLRQSKFVLTIRNSPMDFPTNGGEGDKAAITNEYITKGIEITERVIMFLIDVPVIKTAIKHASGFAILDNVTER